jgi:hypothetical protein
MKRLLLALPLLALSALPASADDTAQSVVAAFGALQAANNAVPLAVANLRNGIIVLMQDREQLQQEVARLREKCGALCTTAPAPVAQAPAAQQPVPAPAPVAQAPAPEPAPKP